MVCGAKYWQHGDGISSAGWVKKKKKCNLTGMQLVSANEGQVSKCVIQWYTTASSLKECPFHPLRVIIVYRFS